MDKIKCPDCGESCEIKFPVSFYFNRAEIKCQCGMEFSGTGYSNQEALLDLIGITDFIREGITSLEDNHGKV